MTISLTATRTEAMRSHSLARSSGDLRGKSPRERAKAIIDNCVHPDYKDALREYLAKTPAGQTPIDLYRCFDMHKAFMETGDMRNAKF